jgi:hypothetical protein
LSNTYNPFGPHKMPQKVSIALRLHKFTPSFIKSKNFFQQFVVWIWYPDPDTWLWYSDTRTRVSLSIRSGSGAFIWQEYIDNVLNLRDNLEIREIKFGYREQSNSFVSEYFLSVCRWDQSKYLAKILPKVCRGLMRNSVVQYDLYYARCVGLSIFCTTFHTFVLVLQSIVRFYWHEGGLRIRFRFQRIKILK